MIDILKKYALALTITICWFAVVLGLPSSSSTAPPGSLNAGTGGDSEPRTPISIHPDNPHYFLFRNRPLALITATEHYGSVINRAFDFESYLADAADKRQTLTRTFLLFREQQSSRNPCSPCKPESPDYIAPWPRTGPGTANDGEPRYDLNQWNKEYFFRLHRFLKRASELGIVVELTLFSNAYEDGVWALNPLSAENNLQEVGKVAWNEYTTLRNQALLDMQLAYVSKIVQETSRYDNVYYEVCNEPWGSENSDVLAAEVDAWQARIADAVREELRLLNRKHLVFGSQAWNYEPEFRQPLDDSFSGKVFDAVNVHPLPNTLLGGRAFQLGNFMSKELVLKDFHDFCRATQSSEKPCVLDEDNTATLYRDDVGWTIHRKRAWTAVMSQSHYDFIDFSVTVGNPTGTIESNRKIRTWMKYLSQFIHSFDFVRAEPLNNWIEKCPTHVVASALGIPGEDYAIYLADAREVTDSTAGDPIKGDVSFKLPRGDYRASVYSPTTGEYSPAIRIRGGEETIELPLPTFVHDVVVRVVLEP